MYWKNLTYLGDSMLLLPTAVLIAVFIFWKSGRWQTAFGWLVTFGAAGMIVSISKILFLGFFIGSKTFNFTGFSGHTTMSSVFWPVVMWMISAQWPKVWRRSLMIAGFLLPLAIGFSRLELHAHSPSEVICGAVLGLSLSSLYLFIQRHTVLKAISVGQLALFVCLPVYIMAHGQPATTQQFLAKLSARLAGIEKPFTRTELLKFRPAN